MELQISLLVCSFVRTTPLLLTSRSYEWFNLIAFLKPPKVIPCNHLKPLNSHVDPLNSHVEPFNSHVQPCISRAASTKANRDRDLGKLLEISVATSFTSHETLVNPINGTIVAISIIGGLVTKRYLHAIIGTMVTTGTIHHAFYNFY